MSRCIELVDGPRKGMKIKCSPTLHEVRVVVFDEGIFKHAVYQEQSRTIFKFQGLREIPEPYITFSQQPLL